MFVALAATVRLQHTTSNFLVTAKEIAYGGVSCWTQRGPIERKTH
jgi:hypothetical protein